MFDFQQIEPGTGTHIEGNMKFMLFSQTNHTVYMLTLYKYRYIIENNVNTNGGFFFYKNRMLIMLHNLKLTRDSEIAVATKSHIYIYPYER